MSTASITHHPLPLATAAAAAVVGVLAFGAVSLTHDETSPSPVTQSTSGTDHVNGQKHAGRPPAHPRQVTPHGGIVQPGLP